MTRSEVLLVVCSMALPTRPAAAVQAVPVGSEFQVNTYTNAYEGRPAVVVRHDGSFVVVWIGSEHDGYTLGLFAQSFSSAGSRVSEEFQVNVYTENAQLFPAATTDAEGNLFVVWTSNQQDASPAGIFGRRLDSTGAPVGGEFQVNTSTTTLQEFPSVAANRRGDFAVAWESYMQDGNSLGVFGQRFSNNGDVLGSEFQVSIQTVGHQSSPSLAAGVDDGFFVVWASDGIRGQRFDSAGARIGGEILISSSSIASQPSIGVGANGNFTVAWETGFNDESYTDISAQRFNSGGERIGTELLVNTETVDFQTRPSVAVNEGGQFVIAWISRGQDASGYGVFARQFDANGHFLGSEFQVNTHTEDGQSYPSVGATLDGDFVVAWQSEQDYNYGIFARRFAAETTPTSTATPMPPPTTTPTSTVEATTSPRTMTPTAPQTMTPTSVAATFEDDSCAIVRPQQPGWLELLRLLMLPMLLWLGRKVR